MAQASQQDPQQPLKNQRVSTPQPRYTQDEVDSAAAAQLPLFTFDLNYPRQVQLPAGRTIRRSTTIGLLTEEEARWILSKLASVYGDLTAGAIVTAIPELAIFAHRNRTLTPTTLTKQDMLECVLGELQSQSPTGYATITLGLLKEMASMFTRVMELMQQEQEQKLKLTQQ